RRRRRHLRSARLRSPASCGIQHGLERLLREADPPGRELGQGHLSEHRHVFGCGATASQTTRDTVDERGDERAAHGMIDPFADRRETVELGHMTVAVAVDRGRGPDVPARGADLYRVLPRLDLPTVLAHVPQGEVTRGEGEL